MFETGRARLRREPSRVSVVSRRLGCARRGRRRGRRRPAAAAEPPATVFDVQLEVRDGFVAVDPAKTTLHLDRLGAGRATFEQCGRAQRVQAELIQIWIACCASAAACWSSGWRRGPRPICRR